MVVYGEYLFIENFITGLIITYITGQLCGACARSKTIGKLSKRRLRYIGAGALCGAYSFVIFLEMSPLLAFASKILFALIVVFIAFSPNTIKVALKEAAVFIIISFLMGGMTIGIIYLTKATGISHNTSIYLEGVTYINVTIGVSATLMAGVWIKRFFGEKAMRQQLEYDVLLESRGKSFCLKGYVDSGNNLKDPLSMKPVTIISKKAMEKIMTESSLSESESRGISYTTVGGQGTIDTYEIDLIKIENKEKQIEISRPLIAMYDRDFAPRNCYEYDALLNADVLTC